MHNSAEIFPSHEIACKQVAHSNTTIARLGPHPQRLCPCIWNCCLLDCRLLHKGRIISWCTPRSTPQGGPCISSAVHRLVPAFHVMPGCCPNVPQKAWLLQHTCHPYIRQPQDRHHCWLVASLPFQGALNPAGAALKQPATSKLGCTQTQQR